MSSAAKEAKKTKESKASLVSAENKPESLIKSKKRVKKFGEVFTPEHIVKQMCDLCEPQISSLTANIFEPTCGNGNFLVEILRRKLKTAKSEAKKSHKEIIKTAKSSTQESKTNSKKSTKTQTSEPDLTEQSVFEAFVLKAVSTIYAVDIQADNVKEAKKRMLDEVFNFFDSPNDGDFLLTLEAILDRNIIVGNTLTEEKKLKFLSYKWQDFKLEAVKEYSLHDIRAEHEGWLMAKERGNYKTIKEYGEIIKAKDKPKPKRKIKLKPKNETLAAKTEESDSPPAQISLIFEEDNSNGDKK